MTHEEKIQWMALWASRNSVTLELQGKCGFGRECVGITKDGSFPDYEWYDDVTYERQDANGDVWTPDGAYHKHPCVAVLGRGEGAETRLYDWLKWFDDNGFSIETGTQRMDPRLGVLGVALGKHLYVRMVKRSAEQHSGKQP